MPILMIDNYDSFVFNLERYLVELGEDVIVRRNDQLTCDDVRTMNPSALVISPGPCTPNEAGLSNTLIQTFSASIPILGVCLGHQCIGAVFGANVIRAPKAVHGKIASITHGASFPFAYPNLFEGIPQTFKVMRYHSLIIDEKSLPHHLIKTAWLDIPQQESLIMAVQHRFFPTYGVQFHPESIGTEYGYQMLKNFLRCRQP